MFLEKKYPSWCHCNISLITVIKYSFIQLFFKHLHPVKSSSGDGQVPDFRTSMH
jgi:hypothetical protein